MKSQFDRITYPASRIGTADVGVYGRNKHYMFALLELDVTEARRRLRQGRQKGSAVSFTAWMIKSIADCVASNRHVHALRGGRRDLVAFHDVDVALPIERTIDGSKVPLPLVLRNANRRSAAELHAEIQAATEVPIQDQTGYILGEHRFNRAALRVYYAAPRFIRLTIWRFIFGNPFRARRNAGTVIVTTVNAGDGVAGWILPTRTIHNLSFALGAVTKKPWVVRGRLEVRDILHLTVTFDHDIIDGVPARRFLQTVTQAVQSARGLSCVTNPVETAERHDQP